MDQEAFGHKLPHTEAHAKAKEKQQQKVFRGAAGTSTWDPVARCMKVSTGDHAKSKGIVEHRFDSDKHKFSHEDHWKGHAGLSCFAAEANECGKKIFVDPQKRSLGVSHAVFDHDHTLTKTGESFSTREIPAPAKEGSAGKCSNEEPADMKKPLPGFNHTTLDRHAFNMDKPVVGGCTKDLATSLYNDAAGAPTELVKASLQGKESTDPPKTRAEAFGVWTRSGAPAPEVRTKKLIPDASASCLDQVVFNQPGTEPKSVSLMMAKRIVWSCPQTDKDNPRRGIVPQLLQPEDWNLRPRGLDPAYHAEPKQKV